MIVAVLSRHAGIALGQADVFVNVAGGVRIDEPGADLAIALAIASAAKGDEAMTTRKRQVEVFTAGCAVCEPAVELVQRMACPRSAAENQHLRNRSREQE